MTQEQFILNPHQEEVVRIQTGNHIVIAPAGTGKTAILADRYQNAIITGHIPEKMLCVTFTNRAAKNMADRIETNTDVEPWIGSLHSLCFRKLKEEALIPADVSILDEDESRDIISSLCATGIRGFNISNVSFIHKMFAASECFPEKDYPTLIQEFGQFQKERLYENIEFQQRKSKDPTPIHDIVRLNIENYRKAYPIYQEYKKNNNLLDFDDILFTSLKFRERLTGAFNWVQCDETQDFNSLQFYIVDFLTAKCSVKVYFADYEQLIFDFHGSSFDLLDRITSNYSRHFLVENYRSTNRIVDFLNAFSQHNRLNRWEEPSYSKIDEKSSINHISLADENSPELSFSRRELIREQNELARKDFVKSIISTSTGTVGILRRTNVGVSSISDDLKINGIAHLSLYNQDVFKSRSFKFLCAIVSVLSGSTTIHNQAEIIRLLTGKSRFESYKLASNLVSKGYSILDRIKYGAKSPLEILFSASSYLVFDTETTGLDPYNDDIIQFASLNSDSSTETNLYIQTEKEGKEAEEVHGITKEYLMRNGLPRRDGISAILKALNGYQVLIGHNVHFDKTFLEEYIGKENISGIVIIDSIDLSKRLYPHLPKYKLEYLLEKFGLEGTNLHDAVEDVRATHGLVNFLIKQFTPKKLTGTEMSILKSVEEKLGELFRKFETNYYRRANENSIKNLLLSICEMFELKEIQEFHIDFLLERCMRETCGDTYFEFVHSVWKVKEGDLADRFDVTISTIHRAKGLQFDTVIIPDMNNFPAWYEERDKIKYESAKRQLYVALSRAKNHIHYMNIPPKFGQVKYKTKFI